MFKGGGYVQDQMDGNKVGYRMDPQLNSLLFSNNKLPPHRISFIISQVKQPERRKANHLFLSRVQYLLHQRLKNCLKPQRLQNNLFQLSGDSLLLELLDERDKTHLRSLKTDFLCNFASCICRRVATTWSWSGSARS